MTHSTYSLTMSPKTADIVIANKTGTGAHNILLSTTIYWAGIDPFYPNCKCTMQYVRFYLNYAPNKQGQLISMAVMDSTSIKK